MSCEYKYVLKILSLKSIPFRLLNTWHCNFCLSKHVVPVVSHVKQLTSDTFSLIVCLIVSKPEILPVKCPCPPCHSHPTDHSLTTAPITCLWRHQASMTSGQITFDQVSLSVSGHVSVMVDKQLHDVFRNQPRSWDFETSIAEIRPRVAAISGFVWQVSAENTETFTSN